MRRRGLEIPGAKALKRAIVARTAASEGDSALTEATGRDFRSHSTLFTDASLGAAKWVPAVLCLSSDMTP
jgi:hypothetical protein